MNRPKVHGRHARTHRVCVDLTEPTQAVSRPSASTVFQHDEDLLFACTASHQRALTQPASRGQLRLTRQRLEFEPHGAPRLVIALAAVSAFKQSKASVGNVMAKIVLASGESHIFTFEALEDRQRLAETFFPLQQQAAGGGGGGGGGSPCRAPPLF